MRIGIDCRTILDENARNKAGVAHYTYYLVKYLLRLDRNNTYVLFFDAKTSRGVLAEIGNSPNKPEIQILRFSVYRRFLPYVYSHILLANQILGSKLDVFHSPANTVPLRLLAVPSRPAIVATIHDLAIYRHPEWFPPRQGFSVKYLVPRTAKQVDAILVPSEATGADVAELFAVPRSRITVSPLGVEERFFSEARRASSLRPPGFRKYILFVGTIEPRKNLSRLVAAYADLPEEIQAEYGLRLAGSLGWKYQGLLDEIAALPEPTRQRVKLLGYVPGKALPQLMAQASVFVYPSLYEGFGLPVLEAMAAGCPVVVANTTSLAELVRPLRQPGALVDPRSVTAIRGGIERVIRDEAMANELKLAEPVLAKNFSWQKNAQISLTLYENLFRKLALSRH